MSVLTLMEAARLLHCSRSHLYKIRSGRFCDMPTLPVLRLGHRVVIRRAALDAWLRLLERRERQAHRASLNGIRWPGDGDLESIAGA